MDDVAERLVGEDNDNDTTARTPPTSDSDKKPPAPMMNEAMKRLSAEKNRRGGLGSRLFGS